MKKKFWIIGSVVLLIIAAVVVYLKYYSSIFADEVPADYFESLAQQSANDPTIIKLPEKYSKDAIQKALDANAKITSKSVSTMNAEQNEIIKEIRNQAKKTVNRIEANWQVISKNTPESKKTPKDFRPDSLITIADSNGEPVIPSVTPSSVKAASVADNFVFDATVSDKLKGLFIDAYPKLVEAYGPMSDDRPVKVFYDADLGRSYCNTWGKEIHIGGMWGGDNPATVTHELAHAFHGRYSLDSLWEEGMASDITSVVGAGYYDVAAGGYTLESLVNFPSYQEKDRNSAWMSVFPYQFGARTFNKFYLEDKDFYKKFNVELYKTVPKYSAHTPQKLINIIASKIAKTVEGEPTAGWFSHQYPFVEMDEQGQEMTNIDGSGYLFDGDSYTDLIKIFGRDFSQSSDFDVNYYDARGEILLNKDDFLTMVKFKCGIIKKIVKGGPNFKKYQEYTGQITVKYNSIHTPENVHQQIIVKSKDRDYGFHVIGNDGSNIAKFTNIGSGESKYTESENQLYSFDNSLRKEDGRYLIQTYSKKAKCSGELSTCLGNKITEKKYNTSSYVSRNLIIIGEKNQCAPSIDGVKPLNRGYSYNSRSGIDCGHTLLFGGAPIKRAWGKEYKFNVLNLQPNKKYSFSDFSASNTSKIFAKSSVANTLSGPDFQLLSVASSGNPAKNNFRRRFIFSGAIDTKSVNIKMWRDYGMYSGDSSEIKSRIEYSSDKKILNIIPEKSYNNADYNVSGLQDITDQLGNPIYKFNYDHQWFTTPVNPVGAEKPTYSLEKDKIGEGENIVVKLNFVSSELASVLGDIKLYQNVSCYSGTKGGGPDSDDCRLVSINPTLSGNTIIIPQTNKFGYNLIHYLSLPTVIDNNNNVVPGNHLEFTTLPKPGTEGLKVILTDPASDSEVSGAEKITITFNNPVSAEKADYYVWLGGNYNEYDGNLTVGIDGKTVTLVPKIIKPYKGHASVFMSGLKDTYGNYLNDGFYYFNFTVK